VSGDLPNQTNKGETTNKRPARTKRCMTTSMEWKRLDRIIRLVSAILNDT
jgi:hypothetical protein